MLSSNSKAGAICADPALCVLEQLKKEMIYKADGRWLAEFIGTVSPRRTGEDLADGLRRENNHLLGQRTVEWIQSHVDRKIRSQEKRIPKREEEKKMKGQEAGETNREMD